jgi:hypothetical protein
VDQFLVQSKQQLAQVSQQQQDERGLLRKSVDASREQYEVTLDR